MITAHHRRGSAYIAVLGTAMIITIIGLSSLLITRVQQRAAAGSHDLVKARFQGESTVDLAQFWIAEDPNWRTSLKNDVWSGVRTIDEADISYKLVDEVDGDLANDDTQPVRVYSKAVVGNATRIYSMELAPDQTLAAANQLNNGDIEGGLSSWVSSADLLWSEDKPHGGTKCLRIMNRSQWQGPDQDVTGDVSSGTTYYSEVWVRMKDAPEEVSITLRISSSGEGTQSFSSPWVKAGTAWTKVAAMHTPTWTGSLNSAAWRVRIRWSVQEFQIDDALFVEGTGPIIITMTPVTGSWRQEIEP